VRHAMETAAADDNVRVIVLTGGRILRRRRHGGAQGDRSQRGCAAKARRRSMNRRADGRRATPIIGDPQT
jgi:hypothetical protein